MRTVTTDEAIAAIESARQAAPGGAVAFDGDGTLWSGDVGEDFFAGFVAATGAREEARVALASEAEAANLPGHGTPTEIAQRIHAAYLASAFPEERVCEIITWLAAGWPRTELARFCADVLVQVKLDARLHRETLAILAHARQVGIDVYIVSASPRTVVEEAAKIVGIDNVVAVLETIDEAGVVGPAVLRPIPYGPGKVTRLRERIGTRPLYAAFGDNAFDVPMLLEATHAFAVRPKQRLRDRAHEVAGLLELAPLA